jgi:prepilin peptidase CpaA
MPEGRELVVWAILITSSITDLIWGKVFNLVTIPACIAGIAVRWIFEGYSSAYSAFLCVVIAFVVFFPLYRLRVMGAADVKCLMAIGAWSETKMLLSIAALSIIFGAIVGLFVLVRKLGFRNGVLNVGKHLAVPGHGKVVSHHMPFAPAFLCAFVCLKIASFYHWTF